MSGTGGPLQLLPTDHYSPTPGADGGVSSWLQYVDQGHAAPLPGVPTSGRITSVWSLQEFFERGRVWITDIPTSRLTMSCRICARGFRTPHDSSETRGVYTHPNTFVALSGSESTQVSYTLDMQALRTAVTQRHPLGVHITSGGRRNSSDVQRRRDQADGRRPSSCQSGAGDSAVLFGSVANTLPCLNTAPSCPLSSSPRCATCEQVDHREPVAVVKNARAYLHDLLAFVGLPVRGHQADQRPGRRCVDRSPW